MRRFQVTAESGSYPVVVGRGAWRELRSLQSRDYSSTFVLTEKGIWQHWGDRLTRQGGLGRARVLFVPAGERSKSLTVLERVSSSLALLGADRRSLLILFGGGVIGDLGGFVASTYMRGIHFVQVPTTLLGQVDSAIGGKNAVNLPAGKNLVGTFYPPRLVLADPRVLASLSPRVFRSGLYEVVKHAILAGDPLVGLLDRHLDFLRADSVKDLEALLGPAIKVKIDVVNRDEREAKLRQVLNLGHTFGHALEAATGYKRFLHGESVGWGLLAITVLAERLGHLQPEDAERMRDLVWRIGALPSIRHLPARTIVSLLPHDKKAIGGEIHWVIPERIGKVRIVTGVPSNAASSAWRELQQMPHRR
ncbi:MAG TPA: 3-dehydroquinate synthase [Terriglobia bacterium]|nr:3-dehydroquinate synthase [Terriglobia bacterium]